MSFAEKLFPPSCRHKWEILKKEDKEEYTIIQRCSLCGKIKKDVV